MFGVLDQWTHVNSRGGGTSTRNRSAGGRVLKESEPLSGSKPEPNDGIPVVSVLVTGVQLGRCVRQSSFFQKYFCNGFFVLFLLKAGKDSEKF